MKANKKTLLLLLVFVLFLVAATVGYRVLSPKVSPSEADGETSKAAADFTVYDASGNAVKLSDYLGKPVIVNFWASWCPPRKAELPSFEKAYQKYSSQITFLMVDLADGQRETAKSAQDYVSEQGFTFPLLIDSEFSAAQAYSITSIPRTLFVDEKGMIISEREGLLEERQLQNGIDKLLNQSK